MKTKNKKKKKWLRFRHRVTTKILAPLLYLYTVPKYGLKAERFKEQGDRQYFIVMNHQTAFDQFFVAFSFRGPIYYVASEDLFSNGIVSRLIQFLVAPIPIKKQTNDVRAVMNCMRVAKEGGTIAIAPEGNRTYSGETEYIKPAIAKLAKSLKLPVAVLRIEGGYGVHPRWSDVVRRGKMRSYVSRVIEPEEYSAMSDDEFYDVLQKELYVNEAAVTGTFRHKKRAEYLERAVYVCPYCGLSEFESHDDTVTCLKCGRQIRYLETKELEGIGFDFPFRFMVDWYRYQCDFINALDLTSLTVQPVYCDDTAFTEVILYKRKQLLRDSAKLCLYGDRIAVDDDIIFPFNELEAVTILGRNKLNIYFKDNVYQFKGSKRFNALKYANFFYRYKNVIEGNSNGKFLGL